MGVCTYFDAPRDRDLWDSRTPSTQYRNWFADELNFKRKHWDEGWGWVRIHDRTRPFAKMYGAVLAIDWGIEPGNGRWYGRFVPGTGLTDGTARVSRPSLVFDSDGNANVFVVDHDGDLIRFKYDPYSPGSAASPARQNLTHIAQSINELPQNTAFTGRPHAFVGSDGGLHVIGLPGSEPGPTVYFKHNAATDGWIADSFATLPLTYPVVATSDYNRLEIIGIHEAGELSGLFYDPTQRSGVMKTLFLSGEGASDIYRSEGSIAAVSSGSGALDIYALTSPSIDPADVDLNSGPVIVQDVTSRILHFNRPTAAFGDNNWTVNNISTESGMDDLPSPITTLRTNGQYGNGANVYYTDYFGRIVRAYKTRNICQPWESPSWTTENAFIAAGGSFFDFMNKFDVVNNSDGTVNVFGVTEYGEVTNFRKSGSNWILTTPMPYTGQDDSVPPAQVVPTSSINHVVGRNSIGAVKHFSFTRSASSWLFNDVDTLIDDGNQYHISEEYVALASANGDIHVVGPTQPANPNAPEDELTHLIYAPRSGPWHLSSDYFRWASGKQGDHGFQYEPEDRWVEDGDEVFGKAIWGAFRVDRVEIWCPSFDSDEGPENRAGTMLHEAGHHHFRGLDHSSNSQDEWFGHDISDVPHGALNPRWNTHKHSPYQIEAEFFADLSEFPSNWVPFSVISMARTLAQSYLNNRFTNNPGWILGTPRPL